MPDMTEDQILQKAKELCRCDGKAWNADDFQNGVSSATKLTIVADDKDQADYRKRAKACLESKQTLGH
jgi:hypothetical protein